MKTLQLSIFKLLAMLAMFLPTAAAAYTQWHLPEGATARLGKGIIQDITYSPDGTRLAVATTIGVWLYDARTYQEVALMLRRSLTAMTFSPDGRMLATAHADNPIQLWAGHSGQHLATFTGYVTDVNALAYSPDGETLAVADATEIRLWHAKTGKQRVVLQGHDGYVDNLAFSSNGKTLMSVSANEAIRVWDTNTGELLATFPISTGRFTTSVFSPDGKRFVNANWNARRIRVWDTQTGSLLHTIREQTQVLAFSPDGKTLVSRGDGSRLNYPIQLWDVETGQAGTTLLGHTWDVAAAAFSPDGKTLASGSLDGTLRLWDTETGATRMSIQGHTGAIEAVAISPDGSIVAGGSSPEHTIHLWDTHTKQYSARLEAPAFSVQKIAFSSDGELLASGSFEEVLIWSVRAGELRDRYQTWYSAFAFSPDGKTLASGRFDSTIRLWDARTLQNRYAAQHLMTLEGKGYSLNALVYSPDGKLIAGAGREGWIWLWNSATGELHDSLTGHRESVDFLAFSPDGKTLASSSGDETIRLWDVEKGTLQDILHGHRAEVSAIAFSPDGQTLASGSVDGTVRLWDTGSPWHRATLRGQPDGVTAVVFSPDGRTLASGSWDGTILLWEVPPSPAAFVRIEPSHVETPPVGEHLHVNVNITGGQNVRGYQLTVQFDPASLRHVSSPNGDYLPGDVFFVPPIVNGEQVTLISTSPTGVGAGDGTLATLMFEVIGRKTSTLTLSEVILSDSEGETAEFFVQNGWLIEPPWDLNFDGVVNVQDLAIVAAHFGEVNAGKADVNRDGVVDIRDLVVVASGLGIAIGGAPELFLLPAETALLPNYPNPFNPETWVPYRLAIGGDITLTICDVHGKVVRHFALGYQPAGTYQRRNRAAYWNGKNELGEPVSSGVYFYTLTAGDFSATRKMVIRR